MLIVTMIAESTGSTLLGISPQSEAFLVEGQGKNFTCESQGMSACQLPL